jgi:hypothetical protein
MLKKTIAITGLGFALASGSVLAQDKAESSTVTCADLNWSAEVLARNPDIGQTCTAVYEKDGNLYAKVPVEVVRTRGNTMTFRTVHLDGSRGDSRSVTMDPSFRAQIGGRSYRVSDLNRGQQLNVYLPEDRFALIVEDADGPDAADAVDIDDATAMPETASPLFLIGLAGGAFVALGGVVGAMRRRLG